MNLSRSDRWLLSMSPATMGGLVLVVRAAALECGVVIRGRFDAQRFADLMDQGAFTHASLVPTQLARVLAIRVDNSAPETLRGILLGGAPAPAALLERAYQLGYPVYPTYGMTETTSQVATADPETARRHPGTVGNPLEGVEVRTDSTGEILVRGPTVAPGTLGGPLPQRGGWYPTGDLGHIDPEGHLFVDGRLGYRVISGGVNVDPLEVERVLEAHADVDSACVVGLPDAEWGERVVAAVVTPLGQALDMPSVHDHLRERLHPTKRPKGLLILDRPLPQGRSGKRDRQAVRQMIQERSHLLVPLDDHR